MKRSITTSCLLAVLWTAACSGPSKGTPQNTFVGGEGRETETEVANRSLMKSLQMVNVRSKRENDRLFVQFELENKRSINLAFEWSVDWFDEAGFEIDFDESWKPATIGGGGQETLSIVGPTPQASMWKLALRTPNTIR